MAGQSKNRSMVSTGNKKTAAPRKRSSSHIDQTLRDLRTEAAEVRDARLTFWDLKCYLHFRLYEGKEWPQSFKFLTAYWTSKASEIMIVAANYLAYGRPLMEQQYIFALMEKPISAERCSCDQFLSWFFHPLVIPARKKGNRFTTFLTPEQINLFRRAFAIEYTHVTVLGTGWYWPVSSEECDFSLKYSKDATNTYAESRVAYMKILAYGSSKGNKHQPTPGERKIQLDMVQIAYNPFTLSAGTSTQTPPQIIKDAAMQTSSSDLFKDFADRLEEINFSTTSPLVDLDRTRSNTGSYCSVESVDDELDLPIKAQKTRVFTDSEPEDAVDCHEPIFIPGNVTEPKVENQHQLHPIWTMLDPTLITKLEQEHKGDWKSMLGQVRGEMIKMFPFDNETIETLSALITSLKEVNNQLQNPMNDVVTTINAIHSNVLELTRTHISTKLILEQQLPPPEIKVNEIVSRKAPEVVTAPFMSKDIKSVAQPVGSLKAENSGMVFMNGRWVAM